MIFLSLKTFSINFKNVRYNFNVFFDYIRYLSCADFSYCYTNNIKKTNQ